MDFFFSQTFSEVLRLTLDIGLVLLVLIFILVGVRLFRVLGIAQEVAESVSEVVETINTVLWQPIRLLSILKKTIKKIFKK